jgi:hypothetical protein
MMAATKTSVGVVDKAVLKRLREEFDKRRITDASCALSEIRSDARDLDRWQQDLSKLHSMAMYLIKDDYLHAPRGDDPIWELAETLSMEIGEWKEKIDEICDMLDDLSLLAPDPDEEDEADAFDADED